MSYLNERKPSFSGLFDYTNELKSLSIAYGKAADYSQERLVFTMLVKYYECLKKSARLKSQADYCRQVMEELNPAFCQGYFKTKKS